MFVRKRAMLKSCNICGGMHKVGVRCPQKKFAKKSGGDEDSFRSSKLWQNKREEIKQRDKYLCVYCLKKHEGKQLSKDMINYRALSVHHIIPLCEDYDKRLDNGNLITLCRACHEEAEQDKISRDTLRQMIGYPPSL